jgi:hypothetical protein
MGKNGFDYWGKGYHSTTDVTRNATWVKKRCGKIFWINDDQFIDEGIL